MGIFSDDVDKGGVDGGVEGDMDEIICTDIGVIEHERTPEQREISEKNSEFEVHPKPEIPQ